MVRWIDWWEDDDLAVETMLLLRFPVLWWEPGLAGLDLTVRESTNVTGLVWCIIWRLGSFSGLTAVCATSCSWWRINCIRHCRLLAFVHPNGQVALDAIPMRSCSYFQHSWLWNTDSSSQQEGIFEDSFVLSMMCRGQNRAEIEQSDGSLWLPEEFFLLVLRLPQNLLWGCACQWGRYIPRKVKDYLQWI